MDSVVDDREPMALSDTVPAYTVQPLGSGWVLEIEPKSGVSVQLFVETELEAHLKAAQLKALMEC
jgi:hypothetical protein